MKIEDIDDCITQYHALSKAVLGAAKMHLKESASKSYARLQEFYVDKGKVHAYLTYSGPYSGGDTIELLPEEIAFFEPVVEVQDPTVNADAEEMVRELVERIGAGRTMSVDDTDKLFKHLSTLPAEQTILYARKVIVTHRLNPNGKSKEWDRFVKKFVQFLIGP